MAVVVPPAPETDFDTYSVQGTRIASGPLRRRKIIEWWRCVGWRIILGGYPAAYKNKKVAIPRCTERSKPNAWTADTTKENALDLNLMLLTSERHLCFHFTVAVFPRLYSNCTVYEAYLSTYSGWTT